MNVCYSPISRDQALSLIRSRISAENLVKHMLAVEAIMVRLATRLGHDPNQWGFAGLIHDLDYAETAKEPEKHTELTGSILREHGVGEEIIHAVQSHCGYAEPESSFDWALFCADPTSGFIVACALMHPSRKLTGVDIRFLLKRFKEKRFAAGASREDMARCSELGLSLEEFLSLSLEGMQGASESLGL